MFCFARIWDTWKDRSTGELFDTFSIMTTHANSITKEIGHHRSPVILEKKDEQSWLNDKLTDDEIASLLLPHPGAEFVAEPISPEISHKENKDPDLLQPIVDLGQYTVQVERPPAKKVYRKELTKVDLFRVCFFNLKPWPNWLQ